MPHERRVLIGGIGYPDLSDHSLAWDVVDVLSTRDLGPHVRVEDISYNPIAVMQRLQDEPEAKRFTRLVVVSAVERPGRAPGEMVAYRWDGTLPGADDVQRAVGDAVTGIIDLDNTLVVLRQFGALPAETAVIEVQPLRESFGDVLTEPVARALPAVCDLAVALASDESVWSRLPVGLLGGRIAGAS